MATTTNGSSTRRTRSRDYGLSNTTDNLQSNDRVDRASHRRVANGAGESLYSSSTRRGYGSAVELREDVAGANSAANSGQPLYGRGHPASRRTLAPQTTASKSLRPTIDDDAEQVARYQIDSVCTPH